jgi:single-strand DNA-binding protein
VYRGSGGGSSSGTVRCWVISCFCRFVPSGEKERASLLEAMMAASPALRLTRCIAERIYSFSEGAAAGSLRGLGASSARLQRFSTQGFGEDESPPSGLHVPDPDIPQGFTETASTQSLPFDFRLPDISDYHADTKAPSSPASFDALRPTADPSSNITNVASPERLDANNGRTMFENYSRSGAEAFTPRGVYKAILLGEVGQSPVQKILKSGRAVTIFTVGTGGIHNNRRPLEGESPEEYAERSYTQWHRVAVYQEKIGQLAMRNIKQGTQVYLEGNIETRVYNEPVNGIVKRIREIAIRQNGRLLFMDQEPPAAAVAVAATAKDEGFETENASDVIGLSSS